MLSKKLLGVLGVTALFLTSCNPGTPEVSTFTIGALGPLTGDASAYGVEFQRSVELAVQDVNAAWASQNMNLQVVWENGACNGKDASTATQKLVDVDAVDVILGGFCSSETLAAAAITEPAGVVLFSPASSSPDVSTAGEYVFRNWPSDAFQGQKLAELANSMGYTKVAMISEVQDYTKGIATVFKSTFEGFGGTVVEETFLPEDIDFKTQLTKLKAEEADAFLVNPQTPVKADVILKQIQEMGITGPFLLNDVTGTSTDLLSTYAEYLEGSYTATVAVDNEDPDVVNFMDRYEVAYGAPLQYLAYSATAYDAVWILAEALAEKGNDGMMIRDYLNTFTGYTGLAGTYSFDENGDPKTGHAVYVVEGGEIVKEQQQE